MSIFDIILVVAGGVIAVFIGFMLFWKIYFLRDPEREIDSDKNSIVAPADGTILDIINLKSKEKSKLNLKKGIGNIQLICSDVADECKVILIFMSLFNVHVNRVSYLGKVISIKHTVGSFFPANKRKALLNEKNEVLLKTDFGKMKIVQVAGFLARRIECWVKPMEQLVKGQRFGRINLGSMVILVVPSKVKLSVKKGQHVSAGKTKVGSI